MIEIIVDVIIACIAIVCIRNFSFGFLLSLCTRILFPPYVRFIAGSLTFAINDFLLLTLAVSFLLHKPFLDEKKSTVYFPHGLLIYLIFTYTTTFVLILLSSDIVPFEFQLNSFIKSSVQDIFYTIFAFYALKNFNTKHINILFYCAISAGIYGILVYITKINPYIDALSFLYVGENRFDFFLEQIRGGLIGRTSGTLEHPLTWGQIWGILFALFLIYKDCIKSKLTKYLFIILAVVNILFSGSRTSIVVLCCIIFFYLISIKKKKLIRYIVFALASFFILLIPLKNIQYTENYIKYIESGLFFWDNSYSDAANISGSNISMRSEQLEATLDIASKNSIGGLGYNSVQYFSSSSFDRMYGFESVLFRKIVEQGILGFICFCLSLYIFTKWIFKHISKEKKVLWLGYFTSYFLSIVFTGIQNTWSFFFLSAFFAISTHQYIPQKKHVQ